MTPNDKVRKAAVEIEASKEFALQYMRNNCSELLKADPDEYHLRLGMLVDCISDWTALRYCHVTEMEAVVEKCRIFIKQSVCHLPWAMPTSIARKERNNWFKRKKEALSSIDALKGDKR